MTSNAPMNIDEGRGSLGKKTIESLREIELKRKLHLAQQGEISSSEFPLFIKVESS